MECSITWMKRKHNLFISVTPFPAKKKIIQTRYPHRPQAPHTDLPALISAVSVPAWSHVGNRRLSSSSRWCSRCLSLNRHHIITERCWSLFPISFQHWLFFAVAIQVARQLGNEIFKSLHFCWTDFIFFIHDFLFWFLGLSSCYMACLL